MALITAAQLADRLGEPRTRVIDVRWYLNRPGAGRAAYDAGHIPTAIFLDLDDDLSDPNGYGAPGRHPLPTPEVFAARLASAGIGSDDFVAAYDDTGGTSAARLWWMLDNLGHRTGAAVLDGGIQAWLAGGLELAKDPTKLAPATLELADRWHGVIEREELAGRLGAVSLLDARAPERYRGEVEPIDPIPGHIPTALSYPTAGNLDDDGRFLTPGRLRARFEDVGDPVLYCGSGTTACHNALALRLAGMPDPILYVGSYSDWSRSGMPVATGPEPGDRAEG